MKGKTAILTAGCLCIVFAIILSVQLLLLTGNHGVTVRTDRSASREEIMTPGSSSFSSGEKTLPEKKSININTTDSETLQSLPGIGPATADAITGYRGAHGPFESVEQLADVPGIGSGTLDRIREYICVEEDSP